MSAERAVSHEPGTRFAYWRGIGHKARRCTTPKRVKVLTGQSPLVGARDYVRVEFIDEPDGEQHWEAGHKFWTSPASLQVFKAGFMPMRVLPGAPVAPPRETLDEDDSEHSPPPPRRPRERLTLDDDDLDEPPRRKPRPRLTLD